MYKLNQNSVTRLADGASIPLADGNRDYEEYKQWLSEGNIPEPEFTQAELEAIETANKISEAKAYLASTDFKMSVDYYATLTLEQQAELTTKRAFYRAYLKGQGL